MQRRDWQVPSLSVPFCQPLTVIPGLAAAAPGVKTFGEESELMKHLSRFALGREAHLSKEAIYWREASSGHSRSAYFVGKVIATLFRLTLSAMHFTALYAVLATPIIPFGTLYVVNLFYFYCTSSLGFVPHLGEI